MIRRAYGRKTPPSLPEHRMLRRSAINLPEFVDLRAWCGNVKDQGELGSCTGHAFSSAMEWIFRRYLRKQPTLSPLYFYVQELIADGTFPDDDGSDGVTGCHVSIFKGCCEDSLYPDSSQQILRTTPEQDENAKHYQLGAFHGLAGSRVAQSVLGDPVPWPVEIGFDVKSSFESDEVAATGIYNPHPSEEILGGHENVIVGYDVGESPTIRPANCPPAFLVQNSWSDAWGLKGFYWMATAVLDSPTTDLKIAHAGGPWHPAVHSASTSFSVTVSA